MSNVELRTDALLGPEFPPEYKGILQKLGGTYNNRMFWQFGIVLGERTAAANIEEAEAKKKEKKAAKTQEGIQKAGVGNSSTAYLGTKKKKKRGCAAPSSGGRKRSRFFDSLFSASPLKETDETEEVAGVERNLIAAVPVSTALPAACKAKTQEQAPAPATASISLELSAQETESDDEANQVDQIFVIDSPIAA